MASIYHLGKRRYRVRWQGMDGKSRSKTCPTLKVANKVKDLVEANLVLGQDWPPPEQQRQKLRAKPEPTLYGVIERYLQDHETLIAADTWRLRHFALKQFERVVGPKLKISQALTMSNLEKYRDYLIKERKIQNDSVCDRVNLVHRLWEWGYNRDEWETFFPRPRRIQLPTPTGGEGMVFAPGWDDCDRAIMAATPNWFKLFLAICRCTGLRKGQVSKLKWADFDLVAGRLTIRPDLGKSRQEKRGRIVPVAPALIPLLQNWPREGERLFNFSQTRTIPYRAVLAWESAEVSEVFWQQRPVHCFRKAFITNLVIEGVAMDHIKAIVGHERGVTGDVYLAWRAIWPHLVDAVALVPPLPPIPLSPVEQDSPALLH